MRKPLILALALLSAAPAFAYDQPQPDETTVDLSYSCFKHPKGNRCPTLKRRSDWIINAKDFGAVCDGASHPLSGYYQTLAEAKQDYPLATALTETIDTAAINRALQVAGTRALAVGGGAGGGTVKIPPGVCVANIVFNQANVDLEGSSGTVIRPTSGTAIDVKGIIAKGGGIIRDLKIAGAAGTEITGISIAGFSHGTIENVDIDDTVTGVFVDGDKSMEVSLNNVIISHTRDVALDYRKTNDVDNGGLYLYGMRIAGRAFDAGGELRSSIGIRAESNVAGRATGMIFAVNTVIDARYDYAMYLKNIDSQHYSMLYISGGTPGKGLVYMENVKDIQIATAWIQQFEENGHNFEFAAGANQSADIQMTQLRISSAGTDFYYHTGVAPIRSAISDVASTTVELGGVATNNSLVHGLLYSPGRVIVGSSSAPTPLTGTTAETTLANITIPSALMGPRGRVEITTLWSYPNSANAKNLKVKFGGVGYLNLSATTSTSFQGKTIIRNRDSHSSQVGAGAGSVAYGVSQGAVTTSSVNTNSSVPVVITGQLTDASETLTLESWSVEVFPAP